MESMKPFILVVDDDPEVAPMLADSLEAQGYRVTYCMDAAQALVQLENMHVGLLIADIMMPGFGTGVDAYRKIRAKPNQKQVLPAIFLTGLTPVEAAKHVPKGDPYIRLLHKPASLAHLLKTIKELTGDKLK